MVDNQGWSPLHYACHSSNIKDEEILKLLLNNPSFYNFNNFFIY